MFTLHLTTTTRFTLILAALSGVLFGCSDASEDGSEGASKGGYPSVKVKTDPAICLLTDDDGGLAPVQVTCTVVVGNASASAEGVAVSVNSMIASALSVCPDFAPGEQGSEEFNAEAKEELAAAYASARADWTIKSVDCE